MAEDKNLVDDMDVIEADGVEKITLIDEDGKEVDFELVDVLEIESTRYAVLMPFDVSDTDYEMEDDEAVIFRLDKGEDGVEIFAYIEDDKEWDMVINTYNDMIFDDMAD